MNTLLKVVGWTLRASALICITYIIVSVARHAPYATTMPQILVSVLYHAGFALVGTQLVGWAGRRTASATEGPVTEA